MLCKFCGVRDDAYDMLPALQIGGYVTQYNGLSFLTIRSAGHQVATMKPDLALAFFSAWIEGEYALQHTSLDHHQFHEHSVYTTIALLAERLANKEQPLYA